MLSIGQRVHYSNVNLLSLCGTVSRLTDDSTRVFVRWDNLPLVDCEEYIGNLECDVACDVGNQ